MTVKESQTVILQTTQRLAFVMSPRLGDSLLSMVIVNNLCRCGYSVTVFGNYLLALQAWFPTVKIFATPEASDAKKIFSEFDVLLHAYPTDIIAEAEKWHPHVVVFDYFPVYRSRIPMPDIQVAICRDVLLLREEKISRENGLVVPQDLVQHKYNKRVIIHPTSHQTFRNWLPQRFLRLAEKLKARGFHPEFIVSMEERKDWLWAIHQGFHFPAFSSLDAVARWIYESQIFIGNDSGIGHLASNLGIPTVTLGIRPKLLQRWRPSWARGNVLLPTPLLITRPLKEKFWKYFISVSRVLNAFEQLLEKAEPCITQKEFQQLTICCRELYTPAMQKFLENPDKFLDAKNTPYLKNNPADTTTVGIVEIDQQKFVVKRYNVKGFWHRIKLWFRKSRAMISWNNACLLKQFNIPCIEPVAIIEKRFFGLRNKAYFISRYHPGMSLSNYHMHYADNKEKWMSAIDELSNIIQQLKEAHIVHDDFHHDNVLMSEGRALLLDLDHMRQYRFLKSCFRRAHKKDIEQFIHYLGDNLAAKEYFVARMKMIENE